MKLLMHMHIMNIHYLYTYRMNLVTRLDYDSVPIKKKIVKKNFSSFKKLYYYVVQYFIKVH